MFVDEVGVVFGVILVVEVEVENDSDLEVSFEIEFVG